MSVIKISGNVAKEYSTQVNNVNLSTTNNPDESRWACLDALQCPDTLFVKNSLKEKDKLLDGLTKWVVQDTQYAQWQNSENVSLLWINGGPGKGKTMMAISLVEQLERRPFGSHQQRPVVVYFFCQNSDSKLSTIKGVIKGLIACLLEQESELYEPLGSRWDHKQEKFKEDLTTWQALWKVLVKMLHICKNPRIYVVIDALDECREQDKCQAPIECQDPDECQHTNMAMFLSKIVLVGLNSRVKWLVTSRPFHIARRELLISSDQVMINLDMNSKHISGAVKSYIAAKVLELQHRNQYDLNLRQQLEAELISKAQDTYLWVSLVCTRLKSVKSGNVLTTVKDAPPGLTSLYGQIFDELRKGKSTVVENSMRLMKAMMTVYRPLRGEEIDSTAGLHLDKAELNQLVDRCAPLITRQGSSIVFVHQSARDYLRAQEARIALSSFPSWSHSEIALSCLSCLSQRLRINPMNLLLPDSGTGSMSTLSDTAPLASIEYATTFWAQHLADAIPDVLIAEALGDHGKVIEFLSTKLLEWLESLSLLDQLPRGVEALMCLANAHQQQQQWLLDPILNIPGPGSSLPTLLHDATRFLWRHYYTVAKWPLQIYSSALLLTPEESVVGKLNLHKTPQWLKAVHPVEATWPPFLQTLTGHELSLTSVVFSKDGKHIVSGSRDMTIRLWDATTGNCQKTLESHSDCVTTVAFLSDCEHIVSGSLDKTIKLWSTTTGSCTMTLKGHSGAVNSVAFLQATNHIASASSDTTVRLWDAATGNLYKELKGHSDDVEAVVFSPDRKHIASASSDTTVKMWSLTTGKCIKTLEGHSGTVKAIAFSQNGKYIASASHDKTVKLWDVTTGELLKSLEHPYYPTTVVFSPDGKSIASSSFKTVILWNTMTGDCEKTLEGHSGRITTVAFSPNGSCIATGSDDDTIKLWDPMVGDEEAHIQGHSQAVSTIACSPDGKHVASGSYDNTVKLWDVTTGSHKTLNVRDSWFRAVAFSPDGHYLASGSSDTTIRLWDLESGHKHTLKGHTGWVVAVAFSPDGKYIASGSNDKTVKIWDLAGECKRTLEGHTDSLTAVAYSPDGEQIASSSYDNTIKLWDVAEALRPPKFLERKLSRHFKLGFKREIKTAQVVKLMQYSQDGGTIFTNIGVFLVNNAVQVATYRELCVRDMWLCYGKLRLLRLAPDFEMDCQHTHGDRIAIGLRNGRVLIFDIDRAALDEGRI